MGGDLLSAALNDEAYRTSLTGRFWSKVIRCDDPDGCWLWQASTDNHGYGQIMVVHGERRTPIKASRVAWALTNGAIPAGLCILHECDNPPCCNPKHLYPGTKKQNAADAIARRRHFAPPRHAAGVTHPTTKITPEIARAIREDTGTQTAKAKKYGLSQSHVSNIIRGEAWKTE